MEIYFSLHVYEHIHIHTYKHTHLPHINILYVNLQTRGSVITFQHNTAVVSHQNEVYFL